jgi:TetR/AcrR family transcriptional regulator
MSVQTPTNRGRGRPIAGDDADLRARLLEAAERLFAEQGYAATSVRAVADAASVNPALVHYYFGGKHGLLEAVLEQALEPMTEALQALMSGPEPSAAGVLRLLYDLGTEHPNLPLLLVREALLPGGAARETFEARFAPRLGGRLPTLLSEAKTSGQIHDSVDPEALTALILGMGVFPFIAADLLNRVIGLDVTGVDRERLVHQAERLLAKGIVGP